MSEFFVGYQPAPPPGLQRFLRRTVAGMFASAALIGGTLLISQRPFANSIFEYGKVRQFTGTITLDPYPQLRQASAMVEDRVATEAAGEQVYLLVAPGKHGAEELLQGYDGARVRLGGQRIFRGGRNGTTMIEIVPGSLARAEDSSEAKPLLRELGELTISGEIVDSKCWLGVMNPGEGKVHRDCASRCLSGGIPPLLVAADGRQFLLVDPMLRPFGRDVLRPFIAEHLTLRGAAFQDGKQMLLAIDPARLSH